MDSGSGDDGGSGRRWRLRGELLQVEYSDGHREQIRDGRFERTDRQGRLVEQRRATRDDLKRLTLPGAGGGMRSLVEVSASKSVARVVDGAGWSEAITAGIYRLTDPNGNLVTERTATRDDAVRISAMAGLR